MIFLTVGTQLPFDRMVGAVDAWAGQSGAEVVAQVGPTKRVFPHLEQFAFLEPMAFDGFFEEARVVIAHAGMGSIIGALSHGKPLVIVPRRAQLGEHRNDHQLATAKRFAETPGLHVAWSENDVPTILASLLADAGTSANEKLSDVAPDEFIQRLRSLINQ